MTAMRAAIAIALTTLPLACSPGPAPQAAAASPSASPAEPGRPLPSPVPDVVARVNGRAIRIGQILPIAKAQIERVTIGERSRRKPEIVRAALAQYVERELLLQEALARGISADTASVQRAYDQMRREHPDEGEWAEALAMQALDPQSVKDELRSQQTVAALLQHEIATAPVSESEAREAWSAAPERFAPPGATQPPQFEAVRGQVEAQIRQSRREEIAAALLARVRAKARIEIFL